MVMRSPCAGAALDPPLWENTGMPVISNKLTGLSPPGPLGDDDDLLFVLAETTISLSLSRPWRRSKSQFIMTSDGLGPGD
jgi:hypothetical protein